MKEPIVYLIEDGQAESYLAKFILNETGIHNVRQFYKAADALSELQSIIQRGDYEQFPYLIILDVNMPVMNAWDFLKVYTTLSREYTTMCNLYLYTSSDHPSDIQRARQFDEVVGFLQKPITFEVAQDLKEKYFSLRMTA